MEIQGTVKVKGETQSIGSSGFQKRELVLTTEEQYPQHILTEFIQDKCSLLDSINVGDKVKVGINLRGREWQSPQGETKYFNSIHGWRIDKLSANTTSDTPPAYQAQETPGANNNDPDDGLPF